MIKYNNILVVIDPAVDEQASLHRALDIARLGQGVKLTLFLAIYDFSYEITSILSAEERDEMRSGVVNYRQEWLQAMAEPYLTQGFDIEVKVIWHSRPFEQILQQVENAHHDLVVKGAHHYNLLQTFIFTPTDWHLIRRCHCPVLLVKEHEWPMHGRVLAALNFSDEPVQQALNDKLIREAQQVAQLLKSELHLVNAFPCPTINIALEVPGFTPEIYNDAIRQHHIHQMAEYAARYQVPEDHTHIREGLPEDVLPELALELDAELVVLGSVGRTGWSAALIGNTAEQVADEMSCDLIVIKPDSPEAD